MNKRTKVLLLAAVLLVVCGLLAAWIFLSPLTLPGEKTITVQVAHADGQTASYEVKTAEEFLAPALQAENLISGKQEDYGLFIDTVDGAYADPAKNQWWVFTVNGEMGVYGADTQPIADGDVFAFSIYEG